NEFHARHALVDHMLDRVAARAANPHHLDHGVIRNIFQHHNFHHVFSSYFAISSRKPSRGVTPGDYKLRFPNAYSCYPGPAPWSFIVVAAALPFLALPAGRVETRPYEKPLPLANQKLPKNHSFMRCQIALNVPSWRVTANPRRYCFFASI